MQEAIYQRVDAEEMELEINNPPISGLGLEYFSPEELRLAAYSGDINSYVKTPQLIVTNPIEQARCHETVYVREPYFDQQGDVVMTGMPVAADHRCASPPPPANVNLDHRTHDARKNDLMAFIAELHDGTAALLDLKALKERVGHIEYVCQESFRQTWCFGKRLDALEERVLQTQIGLNYDEMDCRMDCENEHDGNTQNGNWGPPRRDRNRNRNRPQQNGPPQTGYHGIRPRQGRNGNGNRPPQTGYQGNRPPQGWNGNANAGQQRHGQQYQGQRNNNRYH